MKLSGIKQEILDLLILNGRKPQTIKSGERVVYLYDALNIVNKEFSKADQPQLNDNQQIVLEWLKKEYFQGYGPAIIRTIHLLQRENSIDISGSKPITQAYRSLNTAGEALVVKKFADWALEQEEE